MKSLWSRAKQGNNRLVLLVRVTSINKFQPAIRKILLIVISRLPTALYYSVKYGAE